MIILPYVLLFSVFAIAASIVTCLIRLMMGPSVVDRLLALDRKSVV